MHSYSTANTEYINSPQKILSFASTACPPALCFKTEFVHIRPKNARNSLSVVFSVAASA